MCQASAARFQRVAGGVFQMSGTVASRARTGSHPRYVTTLRSSADTVRIGTTRPRQRPVSHSSASTTASAASIESSPARDRDQTTATPTKAVRNPIRRRWGNRPVLSRPGSLEARASCASSNPSPTKKQIPPNVANWLRETKGPKGLPPCVRARQP